MVCKILTYGDIMKVKELIEELMKVDQELNIVLTIHDDDECYTFDDIHIDLGWEPSGVLSIESKAVNSI